MLSALEIERWRALARYDAEIRAVAEVLSAYGGEWEFEFARAFFALNEDRNYIESISERLITEAKLKEELESENAKLQIELEFMSQFNVAYDGKKLTSDALKILRKAMLAGYKVSINEKRIISASAPESSGESYFYCDEDIRRFGRFSKL